MKNLFTVSGLVIPASQRGRTMGFPTANLNIPTAELTEGIYIAYVYHQENKLPALLFIGSALTFGEMIKKVEVYVLADVGDWYGQAIKVEALKRLRENKKFSSADELVKQMKRDEAEARHFFESLR